MEATEEQGQGEWIAVNNNNNKRAKKRKGTHELPPAKREKKEESSTIAAPAEDDLVLNTAPLHPTFELKQIKIKKKTRVNPTFDPQSINFTDLQNLILWLLGKGINPNWICFTNRSMISQVVVISIGAMNKQIYDENEAKFLKMNSIFKLNKRETIAPGSMNKVYSPLQALLQISSSKKKKKKPAAVNVPITASELVHSIAELMQNGYPVKVKDVKEEKNEQTGEVKAVWQYAAQDGYIEFNDIPILPDRAMIALDCEMCLTSKGSELTRISVVDEKCAVLYDTLVKPPNAIEDYLTQYSGITEELLSTVTTTLEDVQKFLQTIISSNTILIGHSLENDLRALKISHFRVLDTSILYPHQQGPPSKLSLKYLVTQHLHRTIQSGSHDSIQDAVAVMELVHMKLQRGRVFGVPQLQTKSIFTKIQKMGLAASMIDRASLITSYLPDQGIPCKTDIDVVTNFATVANNSQLKFVYSQLHDLINFFKQNQGVEIQPNEFDAVLAAVDRNIEDIYNSLQPNSLFIVTSGQANMMDCIRLSKMRINLGENWDVSLENQLKVAIEKARGGLSFFAVKQ